jgi:hypothetical protein
MASRAAKPFRVAAGPTADHGDFDIDIVGESHYQSALERIAGGKHRDSAEHECTATLVLEDSNPHDGDAVRIDIAGQTVGYFPRDDAKAYRRVLAKAGSPHATFTVPAMIVGGWKRGAANEGSFGVKLNMRATMQGLIASYRPDAAPAPGFARLLAWFLVVSAAILWIIYQIATR